MRRNSFMSQSMPSRQSSRISTSSVQDNQSLDGDEADKDVFVRPGEVITEDAAGLDENIGEHPKAEDKEPMIWTKEKVFTIVTFCLANFSMGAYYSLLGPFFPQEAAAKGMSSTLTGVVFSEFELIIIVSSPLYGAYLTKIGAKHLYISGLVLSGGSSILFGMLEYCPPGTVFTVMCIIVRTVEALGTAGYVTASFAILANTFPDKVATMMGNLELFSGLGLMVGPPIGGILYQAGGFKMPFLVTGVINILIGLTSLCLLPSQSSLTQHGGSRMWSLFKMPVIVLMLMAIFAGMSCIGFTDVALAIRLDAVYSFSPLIIGLIFLVGPGIYALTTPLWGFLADKWPNYSILFILLGYFVAGLGFIFMGPAPFLPLADDILWLLLLTLGLMGLGVGSLVASFQVMTSAAIASGMPQSLDTFGAVSGIFTLSFSLGAFIGPLLGGYLVDTVQFEWACFIFGCIVLVCVAILGIYLIIISPCTQPPQPQQGQVSTGTHADERSMLVNNKSEQMPSGRHGYGGMDTSQRV